MPTGNEDVTEAATKHGNEPNAQTITEAVAETATDQPHKASWRYSMRHINPNILAADYRLHSWGAEGYSAQP